jgi:hypothetical protein
MDETRNACKILVEKLKETELLRDLAVDGRKHF